MESESTTPIANVTDTSTPDKTYVAYFDYVCGASNPPFFNQSQSWDTLDPDISSCFRKTVLIWIPCSFFWLFLPIRLKQIMHKKGRLGGRTPGGASILNISKTVVASYLIILAIIDIAFAIGENRNNSSEITIADIIDPTLRILTYCALIGLLQGERLNGFITSWIQFFFWLLCVVGGTVSLYSHIRGYKAGTVLIG